MESDAPTAEATSHRIAGHGMTSTVPSTHQGLDTAAPPSAARKRPASAAGELLVRLRRFASRYGRLLRDSLRGHTGAVIVIAVISAVGAAAQAAAIGALLFFIHLIEQPSATGVPWIDEHLGRNMLSIMIMAAALVALGVFSAVAMYAAKARARALGRDADFSVAMRVLDLFADAPFIDQSRKNYTAIDLRQLMVRCPRLCGTVVEAMLHLICPLAYCVMMLWIMARVNLTATLLIAPLFLLLLPVLHRFNRRVREQSHGFYSTALREQADFVARILRQAGASNLHRRRQREVIASLFREGPAIRDFYDAYDHMRLSGQRSMFITSLFRPLAMGFVLLILGAEALHGRATWGQIIAYAVALSQLIAHLQFIASQFTVLNRLYPEVAKYDDFCLLHDRAEDSRQSTATAWPLTLRIQRGKDGSMPALTVKPGDRLLLVGDVDLSRVNFRHVIEPLVRANRELQTAWTNAAMVAESPSLFPVSVAEHVLGDLTDEPAGLEQLQCVLAQLGVEKEMAAVLGGLDGQITPEAWGQMSFTLRAAVRLLPAHFSNHQIIVADWKIFARADQAMAESLLELFRDRLLVISTSDPRAQPAWASAVLVAAKRRLVAAGTMDWWIESPLRSRMLPPQSNQPATADAEALLMDDE